MLLLLSFRDAVGIPNPQNNQGLCAPAWSSSRMMHPCVRREGEDAPRGTGVQGTVIEGKAQRYKEEGQGPSYNAVQVGSVFCG